MSDKNHAYTRHEIEAAKANKSSILFSTLHLYAEPDGKLGSIYTSGSLHTKAAGTMRLRLKRAFAAPIDFETGFGDRSPSSDAPVDATVGPFPGEVAFMDALKQSR